MHSRSWLIAYDIADSARLQRMHRVLKRHATAIEYSIFLFSGSEADLERCMTEVENTADHDKDDVRCYALPQNGVTWHFGRATLPEGIFWSALPDGL